MEADKEQELNDYILQTSNRLVSDYKEIISKTFKIIDQDLLEEQIDNEEEKNTTEQKLLEALRKRTVALDAVDSVLIKIESIEKRIMLRANPNPDNSEPTTGKGKNNWTKKMSENK